MKNHCRLLTGRSISARYTSKWIISECALIRAESVSGRLPMPVSGETQVRRAPGRPMKTTAIPCFRHLYTGASIKIDPSGGMR